MSDPLGCLKHFETGCSRSEPRFEADLSASALCSKAALADSVEDPLEASPLCSKVALADSIEDLSCKQGLAGSRIALCLLLGVMYVGHGPRTSPSDGLLSHYLRCLGEVMNVVVYVALF